MSDLAIVGASELSAVDDFYGSIIPGEHAPQIFYDMRAATYHGDAGGPRLSQSLATMCVNKSARHAYQAHPLLGGRPPRGEAWVYEPGSDDGTIVHALVLEPENNQLIQECDFDDFKTKLARETRDAALASGRIPLVTEKLAIYKYKAKALRSRFADEGIEFDGDSEVVICWTEQTQRGPVRCRARIDHLTVTPERIKIRDLKTTMDAHPEQLRNSCYRYGYDIQEAAYRRAVEAMFPDYVGRVDFEFLFAELEKPYVVNVQELDPEFRKMGELRWERGLNTWAECMRTEVWPGYARGFLSAPGYAAAREMMP